MHDADPKREGRIYFANPPCLVPSRSACIRYSMHEVADERKIHQQAATAVPVSLTIKADIHNQKNIAVQNDNDEEASNSGSPNSLFSMAKKEEVQKEELRIAEGIKAESDAKFGGAGAVTAEGIKTEEKEETEEEKSAGGSGEDSAADDADEKNEDAKTPAELDADLMDFLSSIGAAAKPKKSRVTTLPGFLFPDGKAHLLDSSGRSGVVTVLKFGKGDDECERLTSKVLSNSFEVFGLPMDASDDDIRKAYKKLSLVIHPDKCRHPKAKEAFHVMNKAYEDLQRPEMKDKYRVVIEDAKAKVTREIEAENKTRAKQALLKLDDEEYQARVSALCEKMLTEMQDNAEYADKCRKANAEWERQTEELVLEEEKKSKEQKRKWEETRDLRVEDWRDFKEDVQYKRIKIQAFVPVAHRREQRKIGDKSAPSKPRGIDESYKANWR